MKTEPTVAVGQRWADNDPRSRGRVLRIIEVGGENGSRLDPRFVYMEDVAGKRTRIAKVRLQPTRNGYRLLRDGEQV